MKAENLLTFIVSRNYGAPLSFSVPVWRVYLGGVVVVLVVVGMVLGSLFFLGSLPYLWELQRERDALKSERDALREQILSAYQKWYDRKEKAITASNGKAGGRRVVGQDRRRTVNDYLPPIRITSIKAEIDPKWVEVIFRLAKQGARAANRGGFLIVVFGNEDIQPVHFAPSPVVAVNTAGFPANYKSGIRFSQVTREITYRRKVQRKNPEEYFTHVTVYLFSLRGGLLVKERLELERGLFVPDEPGTASRASAQPPLLSLPLALPSLALSAQTDTPSS